MDRRDFVRRILVATAALSAGSVQAQTRPKPPILGGSSILRGTLPVSVKRYDGGSGPATFSGVIPFKPGQMTVASLTSEVSLHDGVTELPIHAEALNPRHADGSIKAVQVQTSLSLNSGVEKPLTLRIGSSPSGGTVAPITINMAWMEKPTLLACTDAAQMCSSRLAPAPLVPTDHPAMPAKWKEFLTTEFDDPTGIGPSYGKALESERAGTPWNKGGNANYNALSAMYYRYMTSGDIDKLADAHFMMTRPTQYSVQRLTYGNGSMKETLSGAAYDTDLEFGLAYQQLAYGTSEWSSGFHQDLYICYALSGWEQAYRTLLPHAARNWRSGRAASSNAYGPRFAFRLLKTAATIGGLLGEPLSLKYGVPGTFEQIMPSIVDSRKLWLDFIQESAFDGPDLWSRTFEPSHHAHGIWGMSWNYQEPNGTTPYFQLVTALANYVFAYLNYVQDPRVPQKMVELADWCLGQKSDFAPDAFGPAGQLYAAPYKTQNPALDPKPFVPDSAANNSPWSYGTIIPIFAYAYAVTGDPGRLDAIDRNASRYAWIYQTNLGTAGNGYKQIGEVWGMAHHAAAWRAGVRYDSWDIA